MDEWLYGIPPGGAPLDEMEADVARQLAADPGTADISDEEAEDFGAVVYMLRGAPLDVLKMFARDVGLPLSYDSPRLRKQVVRRAMKRWKEPKYRKYLTEWASEIGWGPASSIREDGHRITTEQLAAHYHRHTYILWLTRVLRVTGREEQVPAFLASLSQYGTRQYRLCLDLARLKVSELVNGDITPSAGEDLRREQACLERMVKNQAAATRSLEQDRQELERHRREWQGAATRTEAEFRSLVEEARAEVAVAEQALERRRAAHEKELADLAARHQAKVEALQRRLAEARREFAAALAERGGRSGLAPLEGCTVAVEGDEANAEGYRVLVESAGGRFVQEAADWRILMNAAGGAELAPGVIATPGAGLAEFERVLRHQILHRVGRRGADGHSGQLLRL